jgi:hypothetical protein
VADAPTVANTNGGTGRRADHARAGERTTAHLYTGTACPHPDALAA